MNSQSRCIAVSLVALAAGLAAGCGGKKPRVADPVVPPAAAAEPKVETVSAPLVVDDVAAPPKTGGAMELKMFLRSLPPEYRKLDTHLLAAWQKNTAAPATGQVPKLDPDVPIQDGLRVLVEIKGTVSQELRDAVTARGGKVIGGAEGATSLRAMVPFAQLGALAGRADVESISPGTLTVTRRIASPPTSPTPPAGAVKAGPQ